MDVEQKKRTLDALERRFANARTEVEQQQQKNKKRPYEVSQKLNEVLSKSSVSHDQPQLESFKTPKAKKALLSFRMYGYIYASKSKGKKDIDGNDCTYSQICQPVHESLLSAGVQLSSNQMVDNVLHELLQNGDAVRYGGGIGNKKLDGWLHLDSVAKRDPEAIRKAKDLKSHLKRCTMHMSMKQHKKCGSFDLPQELHKYELFEPMHELWKDYILKLTKNIGDLQQIAQRLLSADLHGAILQVVESKVTSFTGVRGIMVRETAETFGVITLEDKFRVVPKRGSIFLLRADCWKITMQGDEFVRKKI
ncbi:ribonuclease P [Ranunculus cassubicifolius]